MTAPGLPRASRATSGTAYPGYAEGLPHEPQSTRTPMIARHQEPVLHISCSFQASLNTPDTSWAQVLFSELLSRVLNQKIGTVHHYHVATTNPRH